MSPPIQLYCLVGPTAVGKTEVAHRLAERMSLPVVSADSMMVYRGMDIGTAKPTREERSRFRYHGLDLVEPGEVFSVAQYRRHIADSLRSQGVGQAILCGGTGLYIKALLHGLNEGPPPDPALRAELEEVLRADGMEGLRARLEACGAWSSVPLGDQANPRRLIRALERAGMPVPPVSIAPGVMPVLAGLQMERSRLSQRIEARARAMFQEGLLEETSRLLSGHGLFAESGATAAQAIGYAEARAVLEGRLSTSEAVLRTTIRTRQYAKRQETWFRRQEQVAWVVRSDDTLPEFLADAVAEVWRQHGPALFDTDLSPR